MTGEPLVERLLPCPFCGAELLEEADELGRHWRHPHNARELGFDCILGETTIDETADDFTAWNTRTQGDDRLLEALRPFAYAAQSAGDGWVNEIPLVLGHRGLPPINLTLGDLRQARAALEGVRNNG